MKPSTTVKSPAKTENLSMESVTDNAVTPEEALGLDMSSSFNTSNDDETANTVIANKSSSKLAAEEGSNTFQRTLIAQGFDKNEAKELQSELVDKLEDDKINQAVDVMPVEITIPVEDLQPETLAQAQDSPKVSQEETSAAAVTVIAIHEKIDESPAEKQNDYESESEDDDESVEELEFFSTDACEKNAFEFIERDDFEPSTKPVVKPIIPPMILRFDKRTVMLMDTGNVELFTAKPEPVKIKKSPKKVDDKRLKKFDDSPSKNGKSKTTKKSKLRWDQSKTMQTKKESKK